MLGRWAGAPIGGVAAFGSTAGTLTARPTTDVAGAHPPQHRAHGGKRRPAIRIVREHRLDQLHQLGGWGSTCAC